MRPTTLRRKHEPAPVPAQHNPARYVTIERDGRVDLDCTVCGRHIAYGVHPERLDEDGDGEFFVEAHAAYCMCIAGSRPAS